MRSNNIRNCILTASAVMVLLGCARTAPTLPSVNETQQPKLRVQESPAQLSEHCEKFERRLSILREEVDALNWQIKGDRGKNQVAGYLGALFILPYLATEHHTEQKARLDAIQVERDEIYDEMKILRCPTPKQ